MLSIIARLRAADGKESELRSVLVDLVKDVNEKEPGTLTYALHVTDSDPGLFVFYENYESQEALDTHPKNDHFRAAGRKMRDEGLLAGPPDIEHFSRIAG